VPPLKDVVHKDLKPANLLISNDQLKEKKLVYCIYQIAGFGLSKMMDIKNQGCHTFVGTPLFCSP
jgi:serine/threonine protein kinase